MLLCSRFFSYLEAMKKPAEVQLKKPLGVVQVYRNASMYEKGDPVIENGRDWLRWPAKKSASGYIQQGELYLPEKADGYEDMNRYSLLFLLDDFSEKEKDKLFAWKEVSNLYTQIATSVGIDFLHIKRNEELELHFNGTKYNWYPKRTESYQLCVLKKNKPVEVKINGKSDGHHQRYYIEEQFVFEYLGDFKQFHVLSHNQESIIKKLPTERKLLDLRELLW
jgi:hypothetical protein